MPDVIAKEIRCPKESEHLHKKILLIVSDDYLSVYCRKHGWLKIELKSNGEKISFENVSAKISSHERDTKFILSPIPAVGIGPFKMLDRINHASRSKVKL